jgi:hypothetical protein
LGVKGGCSPQNNLLKSAQLLPELKGCRNKNFDKYAIFSGAPRQSEIPGTEDVDVKGRPILVWSARNLDHLRNPAMRVLILYA